MYWVWFFATVTLFLPLLYYYYVSVCCHGKTVFYVTVNLCLIVYNLAEHKKCNTCIYFHYYFHLNKWHFAMFCCWSVSSLKVDRRFWNDVWNVFAIMIINREHKAAIKQIKLCLWSSYRNLNIHPEVIKFGLISVDSNLGKSSETEEELSGTTR